MRSDENTAQINSADMINEANRIIDENFEKKGLGFLKNKRILLSFSIGAALSFVICLLIYFTLSL